MAANELNLVHSIYRNNISYNTLVDHWIIFYSNIFVSNQPNLSKTFTRFVVKIFAVTKAIHIDVNNGVAFMLTKAI